MKVVCIIKRMVGAFFSAILRRQWLTVMAIGIGLFIGVVLTVVIGVSLIYWNSQYKPINTSSLPLKLGTPLMGWNSWHSFGCRSDYNEQNIKKTIDLMVTENYLASGYQLLVLDDCWQASRDENGTIIADPQRFPSGIAALAEYAHQRGLQFGIYTSAGRLTCEKKPGSYGYESQDLASYTEWGVDFIKLGWCGVENLDSRVVHQRWRTLLDEQAAATGKKQPILSLAISTPITAFNPEVWLWGRQIGETWRTTIDLQDNWEDMLAVYDLASTFAPYQQVGGWNDADMLRVGGTMSEQEYQTHVGLWAMMSTPLFMSTDLEQLSPDLRALLQNAEMIAINQDQLGIQAETIWQDGQLQILSKPLAQRGTRAVLLLNRGETASTITMNAKQLQMLPVFLSKNIWANQNWQLQFDNQSFVVPPHGSVLLLVRGYDTFADFRDLAPDLPAGVATGNLTTQTAHFSQGLFEYDTALATGKGIGVKTDSSFRYHLNRQCTDFIAEFEYLSQGKSISPDQGMIVEVYVDGKQMYQQMMDATNSLAKITVPLTQARVLDLVTRVKPGSPTILQYGRWTQPQVLCPGKATFN